MIVIRLAKAPGKTLFFSQVSKPKKITQNWLDKFSHTGSFTLLLRALGDWHCCMAFFLLFIIIIALTINIISRPEGTKRRQKCKTSFSKDHSSSTIGLGCSRDFHLKNKTIHQPSG